MHTLEFECPLSLSVREEDTLEKKIDWKQICIPFITGLECHSRIGGTHVKWFAGHEIDYLEEMREYHAKHQPKKIEYPKQVERSLVEEFTGQLFIFIEKNHTVY